MSRLMRYRNLLRNHVPALIILLLWHTLALANPQQRVIVGLDKSYPPYEYEGDEQLPSGYNVDLFTLLAEELGWEPVFVMGEWAEILEGFENGSVDLLLGLIREEQNSDRFAFSIPHSYIHYGVFHRKKRA